MLKYRNVSKICVIHFLRAHIHLAHGLRAYIHLLRWCYEDDIEVEGGWQIQDDIQIEICVLKRQRSLRVADVPVVSVSSSGCRVPDTSEAVISDNLRCLVEQ